jgi:prevent-host-death family protein
MSDVWQVQEAKNRFSEVIERALRDGPQVVTRHGKPVVQVVAVDASGAKAAREDDGFARYLLEAPKVDGLPAAPRRSRRAPPEQGG